MDPIMFTLPQPTLLQNVWDRMHFTARKSHMKTLATQIRAQVRPPPEPIAKCTILVIRHSAMEPDYTNAVGGLKPLLDVLCAPGQPNKLGHCKHPCGLGFIADDAPSCIIGPVEVQHVKCKRLAGKTEVIITPVEGAG